VSVIVFTLFKLDIVNITRIVFQQAVQLFLVSSDCMQPDFGLLELVALPYPYLQLL